MVEAFALLTTILATQPGLTKPRGEFLTHVLCLFLSLRSRTTPAYRYFQVLLLLSVNKDKTN
jgi:hypothetical protein